MNQKTTYEVTITRKLDQLPIPDLREAIWARIEGELDADMPTDDGGDTPPSTPRGGKALPYALPGIVVLIIALFLIKTNRQNPKSNNGPVGIPAKQKTITTTSTASPPPVDTKAIIPDKKDPVIYPGTNVPISTISNKADSVAAPITDIIPPVTDNTNQQAPPLVQTPPPQPQKTDSVVQKKKRGVSGITNDGYRITPVKPDSSRKN